MKYIKIVRTVYLIVLASIIGCANLKPMGFYETAFPEEKRYSFSYVHDSHREYSDGRFETIHTEQTFGR